MGIVGHAPRTHKGRTNESPPPHTHPSESKAITVRRATCIHPTVSLPGINKQAPDTSNPPSRCVFPPSTSSARGPLLRTRLSQCWVATHSRTSKSTDYFELRPQTTANAGSRMLSTDPFVMRGFPIGQPRPQETSPILRRGIEPVDATLEAMIIFYSAYSGTLPTPCTCVRLHVIGTETSAPSLSRLPPSSTRMLSNIPRPMYHYSNKLHHRQCPTTSRHWTIRVCLSPYAHSSRARTSSDRVGARDVRLSCAHDRTMPNMLPPGTLQHPVPTPPTSRRLPA